MLTTLNTHSQCVSSSSKLTKALLVSGMVLLATGCIEKDKVAKIGDAENILTTQAGAVLVTGGESVYGIEQSGTSLGATDPLIPNAGSCTGMAQLDQHVFVVCSEPYIKWKGWTFKAGIDTRLYHTLDNADPEQMSFTLLDDQGKGEGMLDTMVIPNGMAFAPNGDLLIANYNLLGQGSLGRIELSLSSTSANVAGFERDWIASDYGVTSPNGVRVDGDKLYISDNNTVRRFYFDDQGEVPFSVQLDSGEWVSNQAPANEVYRAGGVAIIDDIMPYCGGVAVTRYVSGQLIYIDEDGEQYPTLPGSFSFPSSIAIGQGGPFDGNTLLVTEKGVLGETGSNIGNRLSAVPMDVDLNDPATCAALQTL